MSDESKNNMRFQINLIDTVKPEKSVLSLKFTLENLINTTLKDNITKEQRKQLCRLQSYITSHLDEF